MNSSKGLGFIIAIVGSIVVVAVGYMTPILGFIFGLQGSGGCGSVTGQCSVQQDVWV